MMALDTFPPVFELMILNFWVAIIDKHAQTLHLVYTDMSMVRTCLDSTTIKLCYLKKISARRLGRIIY